MMTFVWLNLNRFFQLFSNHSRLFFVWIRSISLLILIFQIQTLVSLSNYAIDLHRIRHDLLNEYHSAHSLFLSTIRRCQNRSKALLTSENKCRQTLKRLKKLTIEKSDQSRRTI